MVDFGAGAARGRPADRAADVDLIADRCLILIQMSTGVGLSVPFGERERLAGLRPRMARLDPRSMSFGEGDSNPPTAVRRLDARMRELRVKPELEVCDTGYLEACLRLAADRLLAEPLQFSIVPGVHGEMAATPENLVTVARRLPPGAIWQVIAIGRANLSLTAIGLALGGNARASMKDTLHLRKGELTPGNRPLVERGVMLPRDPDLPVAGVAEAERDLGIAS